MLISGSWNLCSSAPAFPDWPPIADLACSWPCLWYWPWPCYWTSLSLLSWYWPQPATWLYFLLPYRVWPWLTLTMSLSGAVTWYQAISTRTSLSLFPEPQGKPSWLSTKVHDKCPLAVFSKWRSVLCQPQDGTQCFTNHKMVHSVSPTLSWGTMSHQPHSGTQCCTSPQYGTQYYTNHKLGYSVTPTTRWCTVLHHPNMAHSVNLTTGVVLHQAQQCSASWPMSNKAIYDRKTLSGSWP